MIRRSRVGIGATRSVVVVSLAIIARASVVSGSTRHGNAFVLMQKSRSVVLCQQVK